MTRSRAIWNANCDGILVDTLFKERQSGRQTDNASWHPSAWTTAETLLAGTETHTGGIPKSAQSCQNRWTAVSLDFSRVHGNHVISQRWSSESIQLKKEYKEVKQIRDLSGFGCDADKHLVTAADDVWDRYIEVRCIMFFFGLNPPELPRS